MRLFESVADSSAGSLQLHVFCMVLLSGLHQFVTRSWAGGRPVAQLRLKLGKEGTDSEAVVRSKFEGVKGVPSTKGCLSRGLNSYASLESSLRLLIPWSKGDSPIEFGPGYTLPQTLHSGSLRYAGATSGVLVFKTPDARELKTYAPDEARWRKVVTANASWLHRDGTLR